LEPRWVVEEAVVVRSALAGVVRSALVVLRLDLAVLLLRPDQRY
jgi:hypothetical protein